MKNNRNIKILFLIFLLTIISYRLIQKNYEHLKDELNNEDIQSTIIITDESISLLGNQLGDKKEEKIGNDIVFEYYYDKEKYISVNNAFPVKDEDGKNLQGEDVEYFKLKLNKNSVGIKYTITV